MSAERVPSDPVGETPRLRITDGTSRPLPQWIRVLQSLLELLCAWLALLNNATPFTRRFGRLRPWHLRIGRRPAPLPPAEVDRLLQRHRDLKDIDRLAAIAGAFRMPESDFFADPQQVERLIRRILEENPPWLYLSRVLPGGEQGNEAHSQEFLWREQEVREMQEVTLFVPDDTWRDQPLASRTLRPATRLSEAWQARLLEQVLPPQVLLDRVYRHEVLIPNRQTMRRRLEFRAEKRRMEVLVRRSVPIPIDIEGGSGKGGQLLYILLDYSASMQGKSATLALAVIAAVLRANMGQAQTRYLFRRYASWEEIWPRIVEPPVQACTLAEKDALLDTIFATNFNGGATHVNDALQVAVQDIENLRREENLDATLLLVTDGKATIMEGTQSRLRAARVIMHTVMVTPETNPELIGISNSFTVMDIQTGSSLSTPTKAGVPECSRHAAT